MVKSPIINILKSDWKSKEISIKNSNSKGLFYKKTGTGGYKFRVEKGSEC